MLSVAPAPAPAGTDLTAEQRAALDAFAAMDADGDGELTADEIYQALSKNDADVDLARVQEIVAKADADGNGTVSRQEYLDAVAADIVPGSWLGGLGRRLGALFAEPAAAAAAAPPREEATPPPPPDPASPAVVVTEPEPAVAPDPASPVVAAEPAAAGKPGRKLSFKERAASKKKELGKAAARAKEAALEKTRIKDPFVERLFDGCVVWSQDWKRDLWLFLKTENPFISTLFSHPDHPYSPAERRSGLVLATLYAIGVAFLFEAKAANARTALIRALIIGGILNTAFDFFYKYSVICPCVQRDSAACVKWCAEKFGQCICLIMAMIAGAILLAGILVISNPPVERTDGSKKGSLGAAFWKFAVGMLESILFYSLVWSCVAFAWDRSDQMKPTDPKKLLVWSGKKRVRGRCGCGWKSPKGELWLKWIGEDKGFEDLPPRPPTYFIKPGRCYACCACLNCCCVCCATGVATWLARRETGDADVDATDERTLAKYKYLAVYGEDARDRADVEAPAAPARNSASGAVSATLTATAAAAATY